MKKPLRWMAALLVFCVTAALFPPAGLAAERAVHSLSSGEDLYTFLESDQVRDGDVIRCSGSVSVGTGNNKSEDPWIIRKNVTIEGGSLSLNRGGILLGADVTFKNVEFTFTTPMHNAIIANGYQLVLDGVTASVSGYVFNVFCGTLVKNKYETFDVPTPGTANSVIIRGNTDLRGGPSGNANTNVVGDCNIYAGSLAMGSPNPDEDFDGDANDFSGEPTIRVEGHRDPGGGALPLGRIYAGGAQQRALYQINGVRPTRPDPGRYTVRNTVTVTGAKIPQVDGAGAAEVNVKYQGSSNPAARCLTGISNLSLESGHLILESGSSFRDQPVLSVPSETVLNLKNLGDFTAQDFYGGGSLILGQEQTLTIAQNVTGKTTVGIQQIFNGASDSPTLNHIYLKAANSTADSFRLAPPNVLNPPVLSFNGGNWTAAAGTGGGDQILLESVRFGSSSAAFPSGTEKAVMSLDTKYASTSASPSYLDFLPLDMDINGKACQRQELDGGYTYTWQDLFSGVRLSLQISADELEIWDNANTCIPDGTYRIDLKVPKAYTAAGTLLTASAVLTVGGSTPDPGLISIPVPTAKTGLRWTGAVQTGVIGQTGCTLTGHMAADPGDYRATAKLDSGYQWTDGTTSERFIPWSIARADGPAAPTGLIGTAPTAAGIANGKITGTTAAMEYAPEQDFQNPKPCGAGETTGLAAKTYYVRFAETDTHQPGAATAITVPAPGAAAVTGISVSSTGHKTVYQVGEALDVTGLTIAVSYSDGTTRQIPVTEQMVSGFDSSAPVPRQVLTIAHEGRYTTYEVQINEPPSGPKFQVTVNNTGTGGGGGGMYAAGTAVTVRAGTKAGFHFVAWEPTGLELARPESPEISFLMPDHPVTLLAIWQVGDAPEHTHVWSTDWSADKTHHWHPCTAGSCPITAPAELSAYAPHTAGEWVVDRPATASQSGTRHRTCTVCGAVLERESLPATGGSSGGGSSSGSGSSSGGGSSGTNTTTVKNPDGSVTTTRTNPSTGSRTETTRRPDGTITVVETLKDGTVTTTDTAKDGSSVKTVTRPGGIVETTVKQASGLTASVRTDGSSAQAVVRLPSGAAQGSGTVTLPIPPLPGTGADLTLHTNSARPVSVEIPVAGGTAATVAYLAGEDSTLLKTAVLEDGRITVRIPDGATVQLRDNRKYFDDVRGHWAEEDISFVTARELFSGRTASAFSPDQSMTRAMLMTVLARLDGADAAGGSAYASGMSWAVAQNISDGRNPEGLVTREQFVTMLYRYAGSPSPAGRELPFRDAATVSPYAREAARWAVENHILSGYQDGSFVPGGRATRAQAASMLTRYVKYLNQHS